MHRCKNIPIISGCKLGKIQRKLYKLIANNVTSLGFGNMFVMVPLIPTHTLPLYGVFFLLLLALM
jgi:hypothetical protein